MGRGHTLPIPFILSLSLSLTGGGLGGGDGGGGKGGNFWFSYKREYLPRRGRHTHPQDLQTVYQVCPPSLSLLPFPPSLTLFSLFSSFRPNYPSTLCLFSYSYFTSFVFFVLINFLLFLPLYFRSSLSFDYLPFICFFRSSLVCPSAYYFSLPHPISCHSFTPYPDLPLYICFFPFTFS